MEKNVDKVPFGASYIYEIKEPGSVRNKLTGRAINKITCQEQELKDLYLELKEMFDRKKK